MGEWICKCEFNIWCEARSGETVNATRRRRRKLIKVLSAAAAAAAVALANLPCLWQFSDTLLYSPPPVSAGCHCHIHSFIHNNCLASGVRRSASTVAFVSAERVADWDCPRGKNVRSKSSLAAALTSGTGRWVRSCYYKLVHWRNR